jgi:catechol 2,3-dioxygenase-like lactoylglutathione lyase family enzyme
MKRFHLHISVADLEASIAFYSKLFAAAPSLRKHDYAKWMLDDPRVNFAISTRGSTIGLDHVGIQAADATELEELRARIASADAPIAPQQDAACCYARSDKYWTVDPQGIAWETFHTLEQIPLYGEARPAPEEPRAACCAPATRVATQNTSAATCC